MATYNKIGFHTSPGGNAVGLGDWMRELDAAGIPFCIKGTDTAGPVYEGQELARASGVPHVLIYRKSGDGWDVPDYDRTPADAAQIHWNRHRDNLPPELQKQLVWLETTNEVDKNRADWLGRFAYHTGRIALAEGRKWAAFGWSAGEPEQRHWQAPGMLEYLALCAEHPDQLAVALHEYSYTRIDIRHGFPDKIGRFQMLFDVCDRNGIPRPTILITEWGWEYNSIPSPDVAMEHVRWAAGVYAQHRQILGANLWHLGGGFRAIADKAQKLIEPIKRFTLGATYPDPAPVPGHRYQFITDVTIPDGSLHHPAASLLKTWRIKNTGRLAWGSGYELAFSDGDQMGAPDAIALPAARPGDEVDVSVALTAPAEPGTYRSYWQPRTRDAEPFGRAMWAEVEVIEKGLDVDRYRLVAHMTIPDGTRIPPGEEFIKAWRLCNTGTTTWKKSYQLAFISGTQMGAPSAAPIQQTIAPGETADVSVVLRAPVSAGGYHGNWNLRTDQGEPCGPIIWVEIMIPGEVSVAAGFHWPVGNRVNLDGWTDAQPFLRRNARGEYHPGADFNASGRGDHDLGAPVYAVAHGLVIAAGFWPVWGNLVLIEHRLPDGTSVWSQYAHLRDLYVKQRDVVRQGFRIGTIGKGDRDRYWAHLHFEIRRKDFHVASWLVRDPQLVMANYHDPIAFIRDHLLPAS